MRLLYQGYVSSVPSSATKYDTGFNDITSEVSRDDRAAFSLTGMISASRRRNGTPASRNNNVSGRGNMAWVAEENIWFGLQRLSQDVGRTRGLGPGRKECHSKRACPLPTPTRQDDAKASLELYFVKPLVSVLFFASWSLERLKNSGLRLWVEIHRDLTALRTLHNVADSCEVRRGGEPVSLSYASHDEINSPVGREGSNNDYNVRVDGAQQCQPLVQHTAVNSDNDDSTVVRKGDSSCCTSDSEKAEASEGSEDRSVVDRGSGVEQSSEGDDDTMVIHDVGVAAATDETVVAKKEQRSEELRQRERLESKRDVYRSVHRDYVALHIHFSCMLLAHLSSAASTCFEERDELDSRFHVVDLAFKVMDKLLIDIVVDATLCTQNTTKYWLELTFRRLRHRGLMMCQERNGGERIRDCWDSLLLEESLVFGNDKPSDNQVNFPASTVDIVFAELFTGITGHGRSVSGRRFLQRCLHDSSKLLIHGFMVDDKLCHRKREVYFHISHLCMKVIRSVSACLSLTTANLLSDCDWRHLRMEKMSMQLTEANLLHHLLTVLWDRVRAQGSVSPGAAHQSAAVGKGYTSCIPVITTLACLLRDITIHEILYFSESQEAAAENTKPDVATIATPFGDSSSFPRTYLVSCFWAGFALLFASDAWPSVCDLLTVFHRHGCLRFLGVIPKPPPCLSELFQLTVLPEHAAVQLVLLQQGRLTAQQKRDDGGLRSIIGRNYKDNTIVILKYFSEFCQDEDGSAALLAFSELVLLCDWVSLNLAGFNPGGFKMLNAEDSKGREAYAANFMRCSMEFSGRSTHSFWNYLEVFADTWKRSLVVFSCGSGSSLHNLSLRMRFLLGELFQRCTSVFNVSSTKTLLIQVGIVKGDDNRTEGVLSYVDSNDADLCSLHSRADTADVKGAMCEDNVLLFQQYFETFIVVPFMSLLRSPHTPFATWSKILSFVSALLWYHEQGHAYITNLLLKFLPDLECALIDVCMLNELVDINEVRLADRLLVSVIAEEVLAKTEALKALQPTKQQHQGAAHSKQRRLLSLVSLIDHENLIADVVKHLVDSFSASLGSSVANVYHPSTISFASGTTTPGKHSSTGNKNTSGVWKSLRSTRRKSVMTEKVCSVDQEVEFPAEKEDAQCNKTCSDGFRSSVELPECSQCLEPDEGLQSHRFGEFVYGVRPGVSGSLDQIYQLSVRLYHCPTNYSAGSYPNTSDDMEVSGS